MFFLFFFFSSRRRHTRWPRDWSSDVCSSDLYSNYQLNRKQEIIVFHQNRNSILGIRKGKEMDIFIAHPNDLDRIKTYRSEERRVGKECRYQWWSDITIQNNKKQR